ncbi:MAG: hypothetical protein GY874_10950 [Desulfobacteraceae bacterium]|nr:hypothetical protein [Desulfobacteraceae bacterium]
MKKLMVGLFSICVIMSFGVGAFAEMLSPIDIIPEFECTDVKNNYPVTNDIFIEFEITVVHFWSPYSISSDKIMPYLEEIYHEYNNVNVLGTPINAHSCAKAQALSIELIQKNNVTYTNMFPSVEFYKEFIGAIPGIPTTFLVNSEGERISEIILGMKPEEIRNAIESALASII